MAKQRIVSLVALAATGKAGKQLHDWQCNSVPLCETHQTTRAPPHRVRTCCSPAATIPRDPLLAPPS
eukprot:6205189-Prorocentrum_lima.AAC.1